MRTHYANDTMLRRSDQLLLAPENHPFEGSIHLNAKECPNAMKEKTPLQPPNPVLWTFLGVQMRATFKVMVLRGQEELVGPLRHSIIRITYSHDSPDEFRGFERLRRQISWLYVKFPVWHVACHIR